MSLPRHLALLCLWGTLPQLDVRVNDCDLAGSRGVAEVDHDPRENRGIEMNKGKRLALAISLAVLFLVGVTVGSTIRMSTASAQTPAPRSQSSQADPGLATNSSGQNGIASSVGAGYNTYDQSGAGQTNGVSAGASEHTLGQMFRHLMIGHGMGEWQNGDAPKSGARYEPGQMMSGAGFGVGGE